MGGKLSKLNKTQLENIENDKFKNELAKIKEHELIRMWGNEINNNTFHNKINEIYE